MGCFTLRFYTSLLKVSMYFTLNYLLLKKKIRVSVDKAQVLGRCIWPVAPALDNIVVTVCRLHCLFQLSSNNGYEVS